MGKVLEIKKRLESTKRIGRVTNAMQLVSASRFHQSFTHTKASRPYVTHLHDMLSCIKPDTLRRMEHPFLQVAKKTDTIGLILLGSQKGLCGSLNQRLVKKALNDLQLSSKDGSKHYLCWTYGDKMRSLLKSLGIASVAHNTATGIENGLFNVFFDAVSQFRAGTIGAVYVCYHDYVSLMQQEPRVVQMLPIPVEDRTWEQKGGWPIYECEPNFEEVVDFLLTQYVRAQFYQAYLENHTSENAARMVAMKTATDNASRIADQTQLAYNNERQAMITQEIIEIVSGGQEI